MFIGPPIPATPYSQTLWVMPSDRVTTYQFNFMDFKLRIVTTTPLTELWTDEGFANAKRGRQLTIGDIKTILTDAIFVVAEVGQKLNWIKHDKVFDFWKTDLQKHFWDKGDKLDLDKVADGYAYLATEWIDETGRRIVLLEKFH